MKYYIFFSLFIYTTIHSHYFLYPIGHMKNGDIIFFIKQKSVDNIQFLTWNKATKSFNCGLWSIFKPTYVRILPNEIGFSFLDNGRLRIQYFHKRSPKTIDFDQYIYNIHYINWINSYELYFSAKAINNNYSIFLANINGTLQHIVHSDLGDCMYPQKIDNDLFYIFRTKNGTYSIKTTSFLVDNKVSSDVDEIITFNNEPIIFLSMLSAEKGFVVSHKKTYSEKDTNTQFQYYILEKKGSLWQKRFLFSFSIPWSLLSCDSNDRLYESLLPLMPRYNNSKIYFVDSHNSTSNTLQLFIYDLTVFKVKKTVFPGFKKYKHLFVPYIMGTTLILGGDIVE